MYMVWMKSMLIKNVENNKGQTNSYTNLFYIYGAYRNDTVATVSMVMLNNLNCISLLQLIQRLLSWLS